MKLKDIVSDSLTRKTSQSLPSRNCPPWFDTACGPIYDEVEILMRSDASELVMTCEYLETDELRIADMILQNLKDTLYVPSPIVLQAIRAINARVEMSVHTIASRPESL